MSDYRRRRRSNDDERRDRSLPIFPLVVIVVLAGLLLGAAIAHFVGAKNPEPAPSTAPVIRTTPPPPATAVHPKPIPVASPSASPKVTPSPATSARPKPSVSPSTPARTASPKASAAPAPLPTPKVITAPAASPKIIPSPTKPATTAPPGPKATPKSPSPAVSPPARVQRAENVVRSYLGALATGNVARARSYLSQGDPSEATFMDSSARVTSLRHTTNADGTIGVQADIMTAKGEYFVTFTLQPTAGGAIITDHTAIKPNG